MARAVLILALALTLSACSRFEPHPDWVKAPDANLLERTLNGEPLLGRPARPEELPEEDLFELSPAMKILAEEIRHSYRNPDARVSALHRALLFPAQRGGLGISYSAYVTNPAAEAFAQREVNCLSFSLIFVAMSRQMGLQAQVNEVEVPPMWDLRARDSLTFFRHVNAKVVMPQGHQLVADLEMERYGAHLRQKMISDEHAAAQFYNNRAMELLAGGAVRESYFHLRKGLTLNPQAAYLWSNLGNLYRREQHYAEAEAAYLHGLSLDPRDLTLISNLANLYNLQGEAQKAEYFSRRARTYRENNPYYLYALALDALQRSDLERAEQLILESIDKEQREPRFYRLAAQVYDQQERPLQARRMRERARDQGEHQFL